MENIKLTVNIELGSNYYEHSKEDLESIAYGLIADYLNIRKESQYADEERFDMENGFIIGDYSVDVL